MVPRAAAYQPPLLWLGSLGPWALRWPPVTSTLYVFGMIERFVTIKHFRNSVWSFGCG